MQNTNQEVFFYTSMIRCHQFNKQKTKNKTKEKKRKENLLMHLDDISQYSSIMFACVYSTRVCYEQRITEKNSRQINCHKYVF